MLLSAHDGPFQRCAPEAVYSVEIVEEGRRPRGHLADEEEHHVNGSMRAGHHERPPAVVVGGVSGVGHAAGELLHLHHVTLASEGAGEGGD